ncbi:DUF4878 domain-containing protein [Mycobacterium sp. MYCO198283]|uniref:Rv0361 family membrane protein n=1 Tax=Mycobacterium sp. MYCO198283 TaxID=2883505 RepID=UPI001E42D606|nr:DUF4878 domain-containing protein [Mycobacterium sp. MYCO198283]MCG5432144.1 DUF4878 domain-containing protein [Mycobacterium sp. MYCO198283]
MSNPPGPDQYGTSPGSPSDPEAPTDEMPVNRGEDPSAAPTEVFAAAPQPGGGEDHHGSERRFTAPGFDAGSTQVIASSPPQEPATEVFAAAAPPPPTKPPPQTVPPREPGHKPPGRHRPWGWIVAVVLVIAALAAVAVLGTMLLTRGGDTAKSKEDAVRDTIMEFGAAIKRGDLAKLRSMTCGTKRDGYVKINEASWKTTHDRVMKAKEYPVIASIDQVVVNGDHAEANVTTFMAKDPSVKSTRSFDLQFTDNEWKICQAPGS